MTAHADGPRVIARRGRSTSLVNPSDRRAVAWVVLPPVELVAVVRTGPAPDIPIASLRALVVPVEDADGRLADWRLDDAMISDPDRASPDALRTFRAWQSTWTRRWPIGPVSNVRSLARELDGIAHDDDLDGPGRAEHPDRSLLEHTLARIALAADTPCTIDPVDAADVLEQLQLVRLALSIDERHGVGVVDDMPISSRSTSSSTSLTLRPGQGLVLRHVRGAAVGNHDDLDVEHLDGVVAVDLRGDFSLVLNDQGRSVRLLPHDARAVAWLVPRSLRWHVRPIPLVTVWASIFAGLGDALATASATDSSVMVSADDSIITQSG
jgi:hypothetical protein